ncbi:MAG: hypothetical protein A3H52_03085 [Candidatus Zambryskibacteria bacterium RIFCSPLOWO2_02_FULL_39_26]|uniref:ASCH domain-containing protein n=1 Tax=Candidatus Zambryskibacteria bacterium RIFCSPLOWO2_12_FULL_39_23 TaxID=1802776 RepID=A0A1G2UTQ3_9BACT|nr:MAG: hypothetical protein A2W51_02940 [Candidatus Zambryskibacteria bacterium RIFCSPHIGHO2_02_39_10]OHA98958.1 MAG: hypothetical protein A3E59_00940 [Candidatus Zambryskibacteria bacterium RIFCSPHIGHO2_12_FULL_39_47]OHB10570.1 MAG: hypothetical protein A3H52_03085 [Candidatus Zambryskibacteria bacterium RIFCSPLOWO2_02_FULL_39_26]OHB12783.1 MAG: hypothetical protein A3G99_01385 [Candidatus Zambryskibacteria bacterium RIFCSPLOWO2_12_FULL_39_23]
MEHVAIMRKSWRLTQKILSGQKKIESRWYSVKYRPWDCIKKGETIYFKDSGEPVKIRTKVRKVIQLSDLTPKKVRKLLNKYGKNDGLEKEKIVEFFERFKDKKYCILIFLKNPQKIKPFDLDKTGFGAMSAWLTIDDVSKIKITSLKHGKNQ